MFEPNQLTSSSSSEVLEFLRSFCEFGENRVYVLSAIARPKENEQISHNSIPTLREIVTREEKLKSKYSRLKALSQEYIADEGGNLTFRLYISTNARDVDKSFFLYQKRLVDLNKKKMSGHEPSADHIKRLDKEWISTLQTEGNKVDNYFIIDVDQDSEEAYRKALDLLSPVTEIITANKTPNGYHIITEPFNYPDWEGLSSEIDIEVKTDSMMFIQML